MAGRRVGVLPLGQPREGIRGHRFPVRHGRRRARDLVESADVLIHNLRAGAIERLGLGEDDVRGYNPTIIYGVASAFGSDGPYAGRAGIDIVFQAESGMISITGSEGGPPSKTATTIGDYVAATNLVAGVCAALAEPGRPGRRVDVALRDSLMAVQGGWNAIAFHQDRQPARIGTASVFTAPNQVFATHDGHIALAIISDDHFSRLCESLELPDLRDRYPTNEDRMVAVEEVAASLAPVFASRTSDHWIELLVDIGLPIGRVLTLPETWDDPQVVHNEMVVEIDHPTAGTVRVVGSPIRFDGRATTSRIPPPLLG
jgi:CoA:oxalate CoA-transferase